MTETFFDQGYDQYKTKPDLKLIEVWRLACSLTDTMDGPYDFVEGYTAARKHRDEAQAENVKP